MRIAGYQLNLDALLARIVYRWRWRIILTTIILALGAGLATGALPPVWRGEARLIVGAEPGAQITVDGRAWPTTTYAGAHRVAATLADGRTAWADVTLAAGETLTLTLPSGLPSPRVQLLAPAAPGLRIDRVWWADESWRMLSVPAPLPTPEGEAVSPAPTPYAGQTVALGAGRAERLATIDAYAGLADQAHVGGALVEAVYAPDPQAERMGTSAGTVEVRGWDAQTRAVMVAAPLTLVRFSPQGDSLLLAEQTAAGEQVSLVTRGGTHIPLVAVPGHITRVTWHDAGDAVVLASRQGDRLMLTLIRLRPSVVTAVLADLDAAAYAGDLVPLAWDDDALLWVAPNTSGTSTLWRAPLAAPVAEQLIPMDARALARLPNGDLRVLAAQGEQLVVGRYGGQQFIGEAVIPGLAPAADLAGMWQGDVLLVQSGERAWLIDFSAAKEQE